MKNLICMLFGHKFYIILFHKTGKTKYDEYYGGTVAEGTEVKYKTKCCMRCGSKSADVKRKIKNSRS